MRELRSDPVGGMSPDEAAAYWRIRFDAGHSAAEAEAFDGWLAGSPAHAAAWTRCGEAWAAFDLDERDPHLDAMRSAALSVQPGWMRRHWPAIAAGLAALAVPAATLLSLDEARAPIATAQRIVADAPDFETRTGQRLSLTLTDGTALTLNTDSAVNVALEENRRVVRLLRGQVFFEVAKDPSRPFIVEAAGRQITAIGTAFDVRLDPAGLQVMLVEGRVSIARSDGNAVQVAAAGGKTAAPAPALLEPGQGYTARLGELERVAPVDTREALLWREGLVHFDDVTLAEAAAELNRYSPRHIILDPEVAALRVSGLFRVGAPDRFVNAVQEVLPIRVRKGTEGLELLPLGPAVEAGS